MYCGKCGSIVGAGKFCTKCGSPVSDGNQPQAPEQNMQEHAPAIQEQQYQQPQYGAHQPQYQQPYQAPYQPPTPGDYFQQYSLERAGKQPVFGGFVELLQSFAGSNTFLVGIILFSVGSLLAVVMSFSVFSIITIAFLLLPIIGFWFMYASSKTPGIADRAITAVTLFKVSVIIDLVILSVAAIIFVIVSVLIFAVANSNSFNYFYDDFCIPLNYHCIIFISLNCS